ncbi:MAG: hypothetical protein LBU19_00085 [Treponema sp.]|jgi:hypothetical protein|nr:hypothetical protein [Treponema sp.]
MSTHTENAGGIYPAVCARLHSPPRLTPGPVYSATPLSWLLMAAKAAYLAPRRS